MKSIKKRFISILLTLFMAAMMILPAGAISLAKVELGSTSTFAVLSGAAITNTGATAISGDAGGNVGLYPGTSFGSVGVTMTGMSYLSDSAGVASHAQADLTAAYNDAAGRTPTSAITADLGGTTLTSGVYNSGSGIAITGTLTLDAQGDPEAVFIFQAGSTLITASNSQIKLINGARYCRIFWQVGSSATLGTNSVFVGHIFALASITANTGAMVQGQLLARSGAVTLDSNTIVNGGVSILPYVAPQNTTYTITANNGAGSGPYSAGATVGLTAAAPSGKYFGGWQDEAGNILSYKQHYLFIATRSMTLTAIISDSPVTAQPVAALDSHILYDTADATYVIMRVLGTFVVPSGYQVIDKGFISVKNPAADPGTTLTLDTAGVTKLPAATNEAGQCFRAAKTTYGAVLYVRGYETCLNTATAVTTTVYSATVMCVGTK